MSMMMKKTATMAPADTAATTVVLLAAAIILVVASSSSSVVAVSAAGGGGSSVKLEIVNEGKKKAVCAKYWVPSVGGGCRELRAGQVWEMRASGPEWEGATMWAVRGSCGGEACHTGPPSGVTQFQFTLAGFENRDYYDLSIAAGFNAGVSVTPSNAACPSLSCLSLSRCQAGATKTCPYASTDYRVTFNAD